MASKEQPGKEQGKRATLHLTGKAEGPPTLEHVLALSKALTGREPTPAEVEEARRIYDSLPHK